MQPTAPQGTGAAATDMDLPAVQSMDWLFKKERIYLLAQFWQQRATIAEKEVNTLKEQLSMNPTSTALTTTTTVTTTSRSSPTPPASVVLQQNGIPPPSPSTTPLSDSSVTNLNNKLINNNKVVDEDNNDDADDDDDDEQMDTTPAKELLLSATDESHVEDMERHQHHGRRESNHKNNNNNNNNSDSVLRKSPTMESNNEHNSESSLSSSNVNNNIDKSRANADTRTLLEQLATKDKEIKALAEEIGRLRTAIATIQETHNAQMQRLEERLEAKRQHISNLETRIEKQNDYDEVIKKESSILRSVDLSTTSDHKQFQELLLERTKALAAQQQQQQQQQQQHHHHHQQHHHQSEAIKSSSSDGAPSRNSSHVRSATSPAAINRPASTPSTTPNNSNANNNNNNSNSNNNTQFNSNNTINSFLPPPLHNVETFGSLLGEEIVSTWRRSLDLPPPSNAAASLAAVSKSLQLMNHSVVTNSNHNSTDHAELDKQSHHSSSASTPVPQETSSRDESFNGRSGHTPLSLPISKSPAEDNNNTLGMPHVPPGFPLSFPFQERAPIRFAEDLHLPPGAMVGRLGDSLIPKGDPMEARLQEMLRYNMDKYANQNLDTLHISRRVRELLSVHNIGQRLFAKYVLGLSQGTVSELLSKPKPWDKLTEKGRDSYRKMHAWACDNEAIMLLKSLIPKKGSEPGMPQFGRPDGEMNDERLQHILTEASSMISKNQQHQHHMEDSRSMDDSKSPDHCMSPFSKEQQMKHKFMGNEQEKMTRMYQEELAKIMGRTPREAFPGGGMPPIPDESIRMALEAYHREFAKLQHAGAGNFPSIPNLPSLLALQQHALNGGGVQDLTLPKEKQCGKMNGQNEESENNREVEEAMSKQHQSSSAFSLVKPKSEPGTTPTNTTTSSAAPSPLSNSILPPAGSDDFPSASPLQRMASITNSLITQPPSTPHHSSAQRPLKAVLPPITQQQFDMYNNLNTEDIVRRVKEALSQYSISQRLFGESVLGLSQGSVSDLLARPKPWHMLTQKGREPFIRMKMFLEDDNAVHKLVASQYKIAPEKLMRTGSYSGSPQIPAAISKQMPPMPKSITEQMSKLQDQQQALLHMQIAQSQMPHIPTSQPNQPPPMLLTPPGMPPHHMINQLQQQAVQEKKPMPISIHSPQHNNAMRNMNSHISPTVYEMAALTQDLDTQVITTKIKEALLANNIGQKIFGEAVLGLSQGSVSELLSKPKPWHMLSIKGREPFIRMQLWLSDANNVERLQLLKNERREASKRRRSTGAGAQDNSSDTSSNDTSEFYHSNSPGPGSVGSNTAPPSKKQRVLFSEEQKEALRLAFALDPYPNVQTIEFLANELGLSTRTITNWFHNHRMRLKQQVPHGAPSEPLPSRENTNNAPFDPVQFRILLNQRLMEIQKERIGLGGMTLPYPYFGANPNLAALISRGLLSNEAELTALKNAVNEQMSGLDLSMPAVKREDEDFDDDENESRASDNESEEQSEQKETPVQNLSRTSRRKPAAPQWVNPVWQAGDDKKPNIPTGKEVIINGVCVMQKNDFGRDEEEPVRVEPQDAHESDEHSDNESTQVHRSPQDDEEDAARDKEAAKEDDITVKKEKEDDDRWEY